MPSDTAPSRKRMLLPVPASPPAPRSEALDRPKRRAPLQPPWQSGECARILTRTPQTGTRTLVVSLDRPLVLGRSSRADYSLASPLASSVHARISATLSDTGHTLVTLDDCSSNGTLVNGRRVHHRSVVLCDGDRFEHAAIPLLTSLHGRSSHTTRRIAGQLFRYLHTAPPPPAAASTSENDAPHRVGAYLVYPRTLGSGAFSAVHLALDTRTLVQVACKRLPRDRVGKDRLEVIRREVGILRRASHPNINRIEAVEVDAVAVHIFLELVPGGDLFTYLIKHGRLDAPEAKWLLFQLALALEYLHDTLGVAHRDVKLENVVLAFPCAGNAGRFPKAQLADFGQAKEADARFRSLQGTLQYMAPEQLVAWTRHEGYDGKKADMWALGILLAHLLTGSHPFEPFPSSPSSSAGAARASSAAAADLGASVAQELAGNPADKDVVRAVVRGEVALPEGRWGSEDGAVRALLASLLAHDPSQRLTAAQVLDSAWIARSRAELDELWRRVVGHGVEERGKK
ncbi:kinase-like domain-containing protein [Rhodotorula diobovata]|uniref:Kinase-like domain-containing protein n=1 Tax=Rhodotorula diobovata TaxID=5288 RepID=A0A5C5FQC3_9BASI|nr:kinase-like domain-containing protein [Rhodotorula diobovata]